MDNRKPLGVAFISSGDPLDINTFSTTPYHMVEALRKLLPDLDIVRHSRSALFPYIGQIARKLGRPDNSHYWPWLNRVMADRLARRWRGRRVVVLAVVTSPMVAPLARHVPVINISDATFAVMRGFYESFNALDDRVAIHAEEAERSAILCAVHNSFSSDWAARSAIEDYGAREADVACLNWGCNIPPVGREAARLEDGGEECRLMFMGMEWRRKGGDVVLEAANLLKARGVPVRLDLAGIHPDEPLPPDLDVTVHGRLNKRDPAQLQRMRDLYRAATFFFMPTRQETYGMVFGEANGFGTPAITRDTGGVSSVVRHGENGLVLPYGASAADFADAIEGCWRDRPRYLALRASSRATYENRLNWDVWAKQMVDVIRRLEAQGRI